MTRRIAAALAALTALVALSGCATRSVDPVTAGADPVPGTGVLHRFCDHSTLIYVSIITGEADNFEAFFAGWCSKGADGVWRPAIESPPAAVQESTNQQDERDEG